MRKRIVIFCEGQSEIAYVEQLNAFLLNWAENSMPFIVFIPINTGGGRFGNVQTAMRENFMKRINRKIWVDYDLYHPCRPDNCCEEYRNRLRHIPPFHFSFHNFEDFLILHYPLGHLRKWALEFGNTGHSNNPLHDEEYAPHFQKIIPGYKKGALPLNFINAESLGNLKQNLSKRPIKPHEDPEFLDFAQFLLDELEAAHPEFFYPPKPHPPQAKRA